MSNEKLAAASDTLSVAQQEFVKALAEAYPKGARVGVMLSRHQIHPSMGTIYGGFDPWYESGRIKIRMDAVGRHKVARYRDVYYSQVEVIIADPSAV